MKYLVGIILATLLVLGVVCIEHHNAEDDGLASFLGTVVKQCAPQSPQDSLERCRDAQADAIYVARTYDFLTDARIREVGLRNHQYITLAIFVLVMLAVGAGLYFSYLQVNKDSKTEIKVGSSIEISSQVVGLIVLFLSLLFFYLYIDRVYPLQTMPSGQSAKPAEMTSNPNKPVDKSTSGEK